MLLLSILALSLALPHDTLMNLLKAVTSGDKQGIVLLIEAGGPWAILISLFISVLISLAGVIPSIFLTGANILVFGLTAGFLISWAGEILGAAMAFWLYRWGLQGVAKLSTEHWKLAKTVNSLPHRKQIYFLTVIRMAPFIPSGLINLFGAITTISFSNFLIATALGKAPSLVLEAAFSYNLVTLGKNYINLGISMVIAVLLYLGVKRELQRLRQEHGK